MLDVFLVRIVTFQIIYVENKASFIYGSNSILYDAFLTLWIIFTGP